MLALTKYLLITYLAVFWGMLSLAAPWRMSRILITPWPSTASAGQGSPQPQCCTSALQAWALAKSLHNRNHSCLVLLTPTSLECLPPGVIQATHTPVPSTPSSSAIDSNPALQHEVVSSSVGSLDTDVQAGPFGRQAGREGGAGPGPASGEALEARGPTPSQPTSQQASSPSQSQQPSEALPQEPPTSTSTSELYSAWPGPGPHPGDILPTQHTGIQVLVYGSEAHSAAGVSRGEEGQQQDASEAISTPTKRVQQHICPGLTGIEQGGMSAYRNVLVDVCTALLSDTRVLRHVAKFHAGVVVHDGGLMCAPFLGEMLGVPSAVVLQGLHPPMEKELYGVPESAAEVAAQGTGLPRALSLGQVWTNTKAFKSLGSELFRLYRAMDYDVASHLNLTRGSLSLCWGPSQAPTQWNGGSTSPQLVTQPPRSAAAVGRDASGAAHMPGVVALLRSSLVVLLQGHPLVMPLPHTLPLTVKVVGDMQAGDQPSPLPSAWSQALSEVEQHTSASDFPAKTDLPADSSPAITTNGSATGDISASAGGHGQPQHPHPRPVALLVTFDPLVLCAAPDPGHKDTVNLSLRPGGHVSEKDSLGADKTKVHTRRAAADVPAALMRSLAASACAPHSRLRALASALGQLSLPVLVPAGNKERAQAVEAVMAAAGAGKVKVVAGAFPLVDLMHHPAITALISDGSVPTPLQAAAAGKPMLVVCQPSHDPMFQDGCDSAARMQETGMGLWLPSSPAPSNASILEALRSLVHSHNYTTRARALSCALRAGAQTPADHAAGYIEESLAAAATHIPDPSALPRDPFDPFTQLPNTFITIALMACMVYLARLHWHTTSAPSSSAAATAAAAAAGDVRVAVLFQNGECGVSTECMDGGSEGGLLGEITPIGGAATCLPCGSSLSGTAHTGWGQGEGKALTMYGGGRSTAVREGGGYTGYFQLHAPSPLPPSAGAVGAGPSGVCGCSPGRGAGGCEVDRNEVPQGIAWPKPVRGGVAQAEIE